MKIDFPLNTELPLRGGGVAVLYEFFDDRWFGRARLNGSWISWFWDSQGRQGPNADADGADILLPKRKAWVVWGRYAEMYNDHGEAFRRVLANGGRLQEITEP